MSKRMRKVVISEFGDVSNISVVHDAEIPDPPADHVQVKVIYSGFSGSDINMRLGVYPFQKQAPLTPGYCLVGTVYLKGDGTGSSEFEVGDRVACLTVYDAQADFINVPEKYLIKIPPKMDLKACCAMVIDWNTAYGMVFRAARVSLGQRVFIHGMSGGVGYALMVLCQLQGAQVYGTASPKNHAAVREAGGTPFVYTNKDWMTRLKEIGGVHAVFDPLGFESFDESYSVLSAAEEGILVGYGGNLYSLNPNAPRRSVWWYPVLKLMARNLVFWSRKRTNFFYIERDQATFVPELKAVFDLSEQGKIPVKVKAIFDLEDIQEAHRSWGKVSGLGSVLIKVAEEH